CGLYAEAKRIRELIALNPLDVVDALVDEALVLPRPDSPPIVLDFPPYPDAPKEEKDAYTSRNNDASEQIRVDWIGELMRHGLREKMALLWSNHFVTQRRIYFYAAYGFMYLDTLRKHALGNFKEFVREIGTTPAMVEYLDAKLNRKGHPNENYARELLELFTVGLDNYTQEDITELARALTGWSDIPQEFSVVFSPQHFDETPKTIFGQTDTYNYDTAIDLVFSERSRELARFVCGKLYTFFVYAEPDSVIVDELADIFIAENYEIAPVVRTLLKSAHFFDSAFIRSAIKTPLELFGSLASLMVGGSEDAEVLTMGDELMRVWRQVPLDPPNVAGWKGNRAWITSGSLVDRWNFSLRLLRSFDLDVGRLLLWISDPEDPSVLAFELAEHLLGRIDAAEQEELTALLLSGTPTYEWSISSEDAQTRISAYVMALVQRPSFQLA
ncbi:MAG: DUF1800 domain-containing protein, partial [Rhodothermales bacterium]|nr:DUF1800 domain-containing protein [Rhodothermales bacterium]